MKRYYCGWEIRPTRIETANGDRARLKATFQGNLGVMAESFEELCDYIHETASEHGLKLVTRHDGAKVFVSAA